MSKRDNAQIMDSILEKIDKAMSDTITLKRVYSTHCQVCGRRHSPLQLVYFIPLDNNLVCQECVIESGLPYEPRIYKEGERNDNI